MSRDDIRAALEEAEAHAKGLTTSLARLRVALEREERPGLPPVLEHQELAELREREAGPREVRSVHAAAVEGELVDEEPQAPEPQAPEPQEPRVAGPVPAPKALEPQAGRRRRWRPYRRLRPFAYLYTVFIIVVSALLASTHWPSRGWSVGLALLAAFLLIALAGVRPLRRLVWIEELRSRGPLALESRSRRRGAPRS